MLYSHGLRPHSCLLRFVVIVLLAGHVTAQTSSQHATPSPQDVSPGHLEGNVIDPFGIALPNVTVRIEELKSHLSQEIHTNSLGAFGIDLPAGDYRVDLSRNGVSVRSETLHIGAGETEVKKFLFRPQVEESISVTADSEGAEGLPLNHGSAGLLGDRNLLDQPFSVTAYSSENAERRGSETIGDSLEGDSSIFLATGSQKNSPFFEMIYSRGLAINNYTGVAVDGLYGLGGTLPITDPVAITEHLSGPAAFLSGVPGNVGGTLNLRPKRAVERQFKVTPEYTSNTIFGIHGDASSRFGSEERFGIRATSMYRTGNTSIKANHLWQTASALDMDYRSEKLTASFDLQHDRTLNRGYSLYDGFAAGVAIPKAPSGNLSTQLPWMEAWDRDIRVLGRARYQINTKWNLFAGAGHTDSRFEYGGFCQATVVAATGAATCLPIQSANLASISSVEAGTTLHARTGFVTHRFFAAFDRLSYPTDTYGTLVLSQTPLLINIYSGDRPQASLLRAVRPKTYLTAYQRTGSVVLADSVGLFHQKLQITVGGRFTAPSARSYLSNGTISTSTDASQWSPALAVTYRLLPQLSLYGNIVQALEPAGMAPGTAANANAIFPALESQQQEIGAKYHRGSINAEAAIFRIHRGNQYLELSNNTYTQNGLQQNRGVDGRFWVQSKSGNSLQVALSYIDAVLIRTSGGTFNGKQIPGIPRLSARVSGLTTLPVLRRTLQAGAYLEANKGTPYENSNTRWLPAWWKMTPTLRYVGGRDGSFTASLLIENIVGADYWIGGGNGLVSVGGARSYEFRVAQRFGWR